MVTSGSAADMNHVNAVCRARHHDVVAVAYGSRNTGMVKLQPFPYTSPLNLHSTPSYSFCSPAVDVAFTFDDSSLVCASADILILWDCM